MGSLRKWYELVTIYDMLISNCFTLVIQITELESKKYNLIPKIFLFKNLNVKFKSLLYFVVSILHVSVSTVIKFKLYSYMYVKLLY